MTSIKDTSASKATSKNTSMEWLLEELRLLKAGANIDTDVDIQQTHTTIRSHLLADVMRVIGEDEVQPRPLDDESRCRFYRVGGKNFVRNQLRQAFNELLGGSDE